MSVRIKTFLINFIILVALVAGVSLISQKVLGEQFSQVEDQILHKDLASINGAVNGLTVQLEGTTSEWSRWQETSRFVQGGDAAFIDNNFNTELVNILPVDLAVFADQNGKIIEGITSDHKEFHRGVYPKEIQQFLANGKLQIRNSQGPFPEGVMNTSQGPFLIVARPIFTNADPSRSSGTIVFGRSIDLAMLTQISRGNFDQLIYQPFDQISGTLQQDLIKNKEVTQVVDNQTVVGYYLLNGISGEPSGVFRFTRNRETYQQGMVSLTYLLGAMLGLGLILVLVFQVVFERLVIKPLGRLAKEVNLESAARGGTPQIEESNPVQVSSLRTLTGVDELNTLKQPIQDALARARQMEEESQTRRDLYAALIDQAQDGYLILDGQKQQIIDANPAVSQILGLDLRDILEKPLFDTLTKLIPDLEQKTIIDTLRFIEHGKVFDEQIEFITPDHRNEVVEVSANLIKVGERRLIYTVLRNITERKRVQNELRRNEEVLRSLYAITSAHDRMLPDKVKGLLHMGCRHFDMENGVFSRIKGQQYSIVQAWPDSGLLRSGTTLSLGSTYCIAAIAADAPVAFDQAKGTPWADEAAYRELGIEAYLGTPIRVGGKIFGTLNFSSKKPRNRPFTAADKDVARLMGQWIGTEMDREQFMEQLRVSTEEIEGKNIALAEARDMALEASQLKSEFLATMSHEIRTPMNAMIGMAELLLETALNHEQREYATIVRDSAQVLLTLINDILDFSKIEADKLELEHIPFAPALVVEGAVDMFVTRAAQKGLSLMAYVSPQIPEALRGDPTRLRQVLTNLISNAIKFTEAGQVVVRAEYDDEEDGRVFIRFLVQDTGIGLSETARERLFQPFTQADGSMTRRFGGTGLGLVISKQLVEMMSGEIGVDSKEGLGSIFWFRIPFEVSETPVEKIIHAEEADLQGLRVLIVDDNATHREIMRRYLSSWSMVCEEANDGTTALAALRQALRQQAPFDLALLDYHMPDMDGIELSGRIRQLPELSKTRLILVTAFDQRGRDEKGGVQGFDARLTKPVKQSALFDTIAEVMMMKRIPPFIEDSGLLVEEKDVKFSGRILLAEDNPANQRLAMIQLQKLGLDVDAVANGNLAVQSILHNPHRYKVVLMDVQMPELDGFGATRQIRTLERTENRHVPIIAMTANAMQGDREICLAAGMDDYISKPVTLDSLRAVLCNWVIEPEEQIIMTESADTPKQASNTGPLDMEIIQGIRDLQVEGESDFLTELIDMYLNDVENHLAQINEGMRTGNVDSVRKSIHTLKGTSGNLGARNLADLCFNIELMIDRKEFSAVQNLLPKFAIEMERVVEELKKQRKS